jgi:hypothetical protein
MRLAGEVNWWAPKPLRRFHDRFGISERDPDARAHFVRYESVGLADARDRRLLTRGEGSASDEPHVEPSEPMASERDPKRRPLRVIRSGDSPDAEREGVKMAP